MFKKLIMILVLTTLILTCLYIVQENKHNIIYDKETLLQLKYRVNIGDLRKQGIPVNTVGLNEENNKILVTLEKVNLNYIVRIRLYAGLLLPLEFKESSPLFNL